METNRSPIVEVDWADGVIPRLYADRTISTATGTIPGAIIEAGDVDDSIDVTTYNNTSKQVSLTLDDTDGSIKALFDRHDIHKRRVRLYQWFTGLDLSDKFLVFAGRINTPVSWNERDRTVKITVVSQIEDKEIGFSAEEGNFPYIPSDLVGKAWPMVFGTVYDYPAVQMPMAVTGVTLGGVGIITDEAAYLNSPLYGNGTNVDLTKARSVAKQLMHWGVLAAAAGCWMGIDGTKEKDLTDQANKIMDQIAKANAEMVRQQQCARMKREQQWARANEEGNGDNPVEILGGEDFPQNTPVWINIKDGMFHGYFEGRLFHIDGAQRPADMQTQEQFIANTADPCPHVIPAEPFDFRAPVPCGGICDIDLAHPCQIVRQGWFLGTTVPGVRTPATLSGRQFWAPAGSKVTLYGDGSLTYVASITPGTVLAVKAYQTLNGVRQLTLVPNSYYTVSTQNYGSVTAVQVTLPTALSLISDQVPGEYLPISEGWSDDLYITFQSSIGPNIVDILIYIIDNYTDLSFDQASFNYVRTKLAPFPANFPLLQRKNVIAVLKEIVFQARCAFWLEDDVVYLKYLPEEPTPVDSITVSDMDAERGVEIELTPTEDIVTKMNVKWHLSYAGGGEYAPNEADTTQYMVLRHNVKRYGLQEKEYEWYIFNQPDIILKCATFWLIRLSNAWKRVKFRTYLHKLNLEAFDSVTFSAPGYIAAGPVKVVVEKADYNSADNYIDFECAVPVKAGKMTQDPFYWPANLPISERWPPQEDITNGDAGGGGIGGGASGKLPVGTVAGIGVTGAIFVGGPNVVFRGQSDWGDPTPTDVGFQAQPTTSPDQFGNVNATPWPVLDLQMSFLTTRNRCQTWMWRPT